MKNLRIWAISPAAGGFLWRFSVPKMFMLIDLASLSDTIYITNEESRICGMREIREHFMHANIRCSTVDPLQMGNNSIFSDILKY